MTRQYYIICFLGLGIVSNVFCQTEDPKIVRDEEITMFNAKFRHIMFDQCLKSLHKAEYELRQYNGKTRYSMDDVSLKFEGFIDMIRIGQDQPTGASEFPSTPAGHLITCDAKTAERIVQFSRVAREASHYATSRNSTSIGALRRSLQKLFGK